jgi:hypothetical protein
VLITLAQEFEAYDISMSFQTSDAVGSMDVRKVVSYKSGDLGPTDLLTRHDRGRLPITW